MEKTLLFAACTGVLLCLTWQASASCGASDVKRCIGKLKTYLTLHELNTEHSVMKFDDEHELDTICNDFNEARNCMADVAPHCSTPLKEVWEGMKDGYEYLCAPSTRAGLMQHNPCIVQYADILESITSRCVTDYKNFMKYHMDPKSYCSKTPEMISCVIDPMKERCGTEAAELQKEYMTRTLNPMFKKLGCIGQEDSFWRKDNPFVWLIVSGGALFVFGLFVTVVVMITRRVRRNQRETQSGVFAQGADAVSFPENSKVPYGKLIHESA